MRKNWTIVAFLVFCCGAVIGQETTSGGAESVRPWPRGVRVSVGVMFGLVDNRSLPEYPDAAIKTGLQGDVIFEIIIDDTGKIVLSKPLEGQPLLIAASMEALRDFRFEPYLLNGTRVQVESQIGFRFHLKGKGDKAKGKVEYMSAIPHRPELRTAFEMDTTYTLWPHKVFGAEPQLAAELAGVRESVYLTVVVGADGKVQDVKVISGDSQFADPVVAAVKQFVYEPQMVEGKPTVAIIELGYHFGRRQQ
jgi:hypothetical protein